MLKRNFYGEGLERISRGVRELRGLMNFRENAAQPRRKPLRENETDSKE